MAIPEIAVHVLSAASELVLTPPADTWRIDIISKNDLVLSASGGIQIEIGSENTGYRRMYIDKSFDDGAVSVSMPISHTSAITQGFKCSIFGLLQLTPTACVTAAMATGIVTPFFGATIHDDVTAFSTLRVFEFGGQTMTGTIYVVYHKKKKLLLQSHDCTASPTSAITFTGLGRKNNHIITTSQLGSAVSTFPLLQVSTDGSSYDEGASDYMYGAQNASIAVRSVANKGIPIDIAGVTHTFLVHLSSSIPSEAPTTMISASIFHGANPQRLLGRRNANQKDTAIRIVSSGGETFNSGVIHIMSWE